MVWPFTWIAPWLLRSETSVSIFRKIWPFESTSGVKESFTP